MPCRLRAPDCVDNLWDAVKETRLARFGKREAVICDRLAVQGLFLNRAEAPLLRSFSGSVDWVWRQKTPASSRGILPSLACWSDGQLTFFPVRIQVLIWKILLGSVAIPQNVGILHHYRHLVAPRVRIGELRLVDAGAEEEIGRSQFHRDARQAVCP